MIPSPGMAPKQPLPGIGLHDPLHGRQACPEFHSFHQGVGQISLPEGLFSCRPFPIRRQICYIPAPPQSLNGSVVFFCAEQLEAEGFLNRVISVPGHGDCSYVVLVASFPVPRLL